MHCIVGRQGHLLAQDQHQAHGSQCAHRDGRHAVAQEVAGGFLHIGAQRIQGAAIDREDVALLVARLLEPVTGLLDAPGVAGSQHARANDGGTGTIQAQQGGDHAAALGIGHFVIGQHCIIRRQIQILFHGITHSFEEAHRPH